MRLSKKEGSNVLKLLSATVLLSCASIPLTQASGFRLGFHSAEGLGRAFAGEAADDSPLTSIRNPASIMLTEGSAVSNAGTYQLFDYSIDVTHNPYSSLFNGNYEVKMKEDIDGGTQMVVPAAAYVNNQGKWGFGVSSGVNFGIDMDPKELTSIGDTFGDYYIKSGHISGNFAYAVNDQLDVGLGLSVIPAFMKVDRRASELAHVVDGLITDNQDNLFGDIIEGTLGAIRDPNATLARFNADGIGWGWNVGLNFKPTSKDRFAFTYHHKSELTLDGTYRSDVTATPVIPGVLNLATGTGGEEVDASVNLELPTWIEFGGWHQINDKWELNYGAIYTAWEKSFTGLFIEGEGGVGTGLAVKTRNTFGASAGLTYAVNDKLKVRAGLLTDEGFQEEEDTILSSPDGRRMMYATGFSYELDEKSSIDVGLSYIKLDVAKIKEPAMLFDQINTGFELVPDIISVVGLNEENKYVESTPKASLWSLGVQYNLQF